MADVAAEGDRMLAHPMRQPARGGEGLYPLRRLGDAEVSLAVGHLRDLDAQHARRGEGIIDIPARARGTEAGDVDAGRREALGYIAGDVDPDEMEGNAFGARPAQRRQPVADLLEGDAEAILEDVDVIAGPLGGVAEELIG